MKHSICHIKFLHCHHSDERDGDEVFLKLNGKKVWPQDKRYVKGGDSYTFPVNIKFSVKYLEKVSLELWDYDFFKNDLLGQFIFSVDGEGEFKSDLISTNDHKYSIELEIYPVTKVKSLYGFI